MANEQAAKPTNKYRNRVVRLEMVRAGALRANPKNHRVHPGMQSDALRGVLAQVGWVDAVLARETPDGLEIFDGHLRANLEADDQIPVLVTDLTEQEATLCLATHDAITGLAEINPHQLENLLSETRTEDAGVKNLIAAMQLGLDKTLDALQRAEERRETGGRSYADNLQLQPHEHYDFVLVLARTVQTWNRLVSALNLPDVPRTRNRIGLGRAIDADKLLGMLIDDSGPASVDVRSGDPEPTANAQHGDDAKPVAKRNRVRRR